MKGLWGIVPVFVGVLAGFLWFTWYSGTDNFSYDVEMYGWPVSGMCLGAPAFMIAVIGIAISIWYDTKHQ